MDVLRAISSRRLSPPLLAGIAFGLVTHAVFLVTVCSLFVFLLKTPGRPNPHALAIDLLLALQFAVFHSLWLLPTVRKWLGRWISRAFYGAFYCLMTCLSLDLTFALWQSTTQVIWSFSGIAGGLARLGFLASWVGLFYSLSLTGLGFQTGFTEWSSWLRELPIPSRKFDPRGAYRFLRHPVYLSFMGLLWFVPRMTLDHLLLSIVWSAYIFVGSWLKDRRLTFYMGDRYRIYASRVAGYPLMLAGPLARWPATDKQSVDERVAAVVDRVVAESSTTSGAAGSFPGERCRRLIQLPCDQSGQARKPGPNAK
jgi:hypothetical protein